jgi:hypothetical protein
VKSVNLSCGQCWENNGRDEPIQDIIHMYVEMS